MLPASKKEADPTLDASLDDADRYIRTVSAPFGPLTDAQWRHLTVHSTRPMPDGGFEMGYDPDIAKPMQAMLFLGDIELFARERRAE